MLPILPRAAADVARIAAPAQPYLSYLSSGLMLGSDVLASYTDNERKKNWFLYQFLDERLKCPVVEWRINKDVLIEYGPLIRGTLFLAFQDPVKSESSAVQILLRPQIRYSKEDDLAYIIPTQKIDDDKQVSGPMRRKSRTISSAQCPLLLGITMGK
jgi:hypothetical protein